MFSTLDVFTFRRFRLKVILDVLGLDVSGLDVLVLDVLGEHGKEYPFRKTFSQLVMCFASKDVKGAVRSVLFMYSYSLFLLIKYKI